MSDSKDKVENEADEQAAAKPSPIKPILFSAASALALGAAAMGAVWILPSGGGKCQVASTDSAKSKKQTKSYKDIVFVNLEPLVVSLGPNAQSKFLKISISIETTPEHTKSINHLRPRLRDVLNSYLRAVDEKDLSEPFAMTRLRAQMLRRLQIVASADAVIDVLITDFVLN